MLFDYFIKDILLNDAYHKLKQENNSAIEYYAAQSTFSAIFIVDHYEIRIIV